MRRDLGGLPLIAEDLGRITPEVLRLRDRLGLPGMVVLQFGFEGRPASPHRLENHPRRAVVYTGSHDHDTAVGWWSSLGPRERARAGLDPREPHWSMIGLALRSRASLALIPAQDVRGLGSWARLNTPGSLEGNWRWRLEPGQLDAAAAARLRALTEATRRLRPVRPGA